MEPTFRAGGLASGLDTNLIVEQLTALQRRPIDALAKRQKAYEIQLSGLGRLQSALSAFETAANDLKRDGLLGVAVAKTPSFLEAEPSSGATPGSYSLEVEQLARAAKARTGGFASSSEVIRAGTLTLGIGADSYDITIEEGATLADVAFAINQSDAPVSAVVLNDGTQHYLSVTTNATGHTIGEAPASALTITETYTGDTGANLGLAITQEARNARVIVDGLTFERTSNTITDAVPDATLTLQSVSTGAEELVLSRDVEKTQANLQTFVDAYNAVISIVQGDLSPAPDTDRSKTLAGDPSLRFLQRRLQSILTTEVPGSGTDIRSLADIGLKSARDGTLSIDTAQLEDAVGRDPNAVARLFSATDGIADEVEAVTTAYTDSVDGTITQRKSSINRQIDDVERQMEQLERRVESFKENLYRRFAAMEQAVSELSSIGNFLAQVKFPGFGGSEK